MTSNSDRVSGEHPVIVVGAGICGLATAYELARRGAQAVVIERREPFAEQSAGLARIFRITHRRPELCGLAMRARAGWQRWEAEFGAGRLLGSEGFITAGAGEAVAAAMTEAGAAFSWLDRRDVTARIPFVAAPWESGVFDPLGGSLRIRRALTALAQHPDASATITRTLFVGLAMIESTAIYCFVVSMILIFANPFWNQVIKAAGK